MSSGSYLSQSSGAYSSQIQMNGLWGSCNTSPMKLKIVLQYSHSSYREEEKNVVVVLEQTKFNDYVYTQNHLSETLRCILTQKKIYEQVHMYKTETSVLLHIKLVNDPLEELSCGGTRL